MIEQQYIGGIFSHFEGSTEKFYYCDSASTKGARMTNVHDYTDQRVVSANIFVYIRIDSDLRRKLGVSDEIVAKIERHFRSAEVKEK